MKAVVACAFLVISVIAEPPVNSRYLPPQQRGNDYRTTSQDTFAPPSQNYGPPSAQYGPPKQTEAVVRSQPGFGARNPPSSQYGAPSRSSLNRSPSQQYGPPQSRQSNPSDQYLPPSNQYNAPSNQYNAPSNNAPSQQYNSPAVQYSAPSQQYGAPGQNRPSEQYGAPSNQYLPPGSAGRGGYAGNEDSNNEPANYNFEYMVKDDESGNDFGHRESRQGDRAEGLYYVLLPDGRKQTVEYEADEQGYRPKISYEDTGLVRQGGYDGNSQDAGAYRGNQAPAGPY